MRSFRIRLVAQLAWHRGGHPAGWPVRGRPSTWPAAGLPVGRRSQDGYSLRRAGIVSIARTFAQSRQANILARQSGHAIRFSIARSSQHTLAFSYLVGAHRFEMSCHAARRVNAQNAGLKGDVRGPQPGQAAWLSRVSPASRHLHLGTNKEFNFRLSIDFCIQIYLFLVLLVRGTNGLRSVLAL